MPDKPAFDPKKGKIDIRGAVFGGVQWWGKPRSKNPAEAIDEYISMLEATRALFLSGPGRPKNSAWYGDPKTLKTAVEQAIKKVRADGRYPSQAEVSSKMVPPISPRRLREWLKKYRLSWSDLQNNAT